MRLMAESIYAANTSQRTLGETPCNVSSHVESDDSQQERTG